MNGVSKKSLADKWCYYVPLLEQILSLSLSLFTFRFWFVGLAYQGKGIVFRIIIEYSSLRDMGNIIYPR
jgi:hypothetical protein